MNDRGATVPGASDTHAQIDAQRAQLLAVAAEASTLPGIDATALVALRAKLEGRVFNLVVVGEFKRGKSSVVNALLGAEVLPVGVVPLTSIVTVLRHGDSPAATVGFDDGRHEAIALARLPEFVTERGNPRNAKRVREVEVVFPAPWLRRGFRLIDTPGIGSAYQHNTDVTQAYLPQADAVIFVASVDQPVSASELAFLADIRAYAGRVFCLLNKADYLSPAELVESVAYATPLLREALGTSVAVFPVSARMALRARSGSADEAFATNGFDAFDAALRQFLERDSGAVWVGSGRRHLSRLLGACRLVAELELQALAAPLDALETSLRTFAARKAETLQARADLDALLEADTRRLIQDRVEPDINTFKQTLLNTLDGDLPVWLEAAVVAHKGSLEEALEQQIVSAVRRAFDEFRAREDAIATADFERICDRFWQRIQQVVDELMCASAELFSIRFAPVATEPLHQARSRFYYQFWQEPLSMQLLGNALTRLVPGALGRRLVLRRARRRFVELVDMQSGRLRHDFAERAMHAMEATRGEMLGRVDAAIDAIVGAIDKGRSLRSGGATLAALRQREITELLARIMVLDERVAAAA